MPGWRALAAVGGVLALSGVVFAALGSHAVPGMDDPQIFRRWQAASLIHLSHAAALLALAGLCQQRESRLLAWSGLLTATGVLLFSGSLYLQTMLGLPGTFSIAPAGGLLLMLGWLLAIAGFLRA
jgi:uncharacterized membrane protein YgdD (TMEM256/DUF423 family)